MLQLSISFTLLNTKNIDYLFSTDRKKRTGHKKHNLPTTHNHATCFLWVLRYKIDKSLKLECESFCKIKNINIVREKKYHEQSDSQMFLWNIINGGDGVKQGCILPLFCRIPWKIFSRLEHLKFASGICFLTQKESNMNEKILNRHSS